MTEQHNRLRQLCDPAKKIRETWYGDYYSARVTHEGLAKTCDVLHVQIPLSDRKLSEAVKMFNLQKDEQEDFSVWLWERVQNHVKTLSQLKKEGAKNIVELWFADKFEEDGTKDIYILTAPCVPYAEQIEGKRLVIKDLYGLAVRLGNIIRGVNLAGFVHGDVSLSAIYVTEENQLVLNDFYYAAVFGSDPDPRRYRYILPAHIPEEIAVSGEVNDCTDVYALCSLLWHLASEIPADIRTPYLTTIPKGPEELSELLYRVMSTTDAPLELYRKQTSKLLANASKNLDIYSALSYYVPECREKYEPIPAEGDAPETEPTEGELLDVIAPIPTNEPEEKLEQEREQEQVQQVQEHFQQPESTGEQNQQKAEPEPEPSEVDTQEPGADDRTDPPSEEVASRKSEALFEEVQL